MQSHIANGLTTFATEKHALWLSGCEFPSALRYMTLTAIFVTGSMAIYKLLCSYNDFCNKLKLVNADYSVMRSIWIVV